MVKVLHNQTLIDIAMQEFGNASYALPIAVSLGRSITDDLVAGEYLAMPNIENTSKEKNIAYVMKQKLNIYASNDLTNGVVQGGIGFMEIGNDFIVN